MTEVAMEPHIRHLAALDRRLDELNVEIAAALRANLPDQRMLLVARLGDDHAAISRFHASI